MGGRQNSGPFLGTLNIRCRTIIRTQKGTQILTTTLHVIRGSFVEPIIQRYRSLGLRRLRASGTDLCMGQVFGKTVEAPD